MKLNERMEFDHPVEIHTDGTVTDAPAGIYAPEVTDDGDVIVSGMTGQDWELLNGYSGQYGYAGPVMHPSEYIGGGLERDILETPGVYVVTEVTWLGDDGDGLNSDDPHGWAVARLVTS